MQASIFRNIFLKKMKEVVLIKAKKSLNPVFVRRQAFLIFLRKLYRTLLSQ